MHPMYKKICSIKQLQTLKLRVLNVSIFDSRQLGLESISKKKHVYINVTLVIHSLSKNVMQNKKIKDIGNGCMMYVNLFFLNKKPILQT